MKYALAFMALAWAAILGITLTGCGTGCGGLGSCIELDPEPPTCTELVTDECVPEVIEEFCPVAGEPETCPPARVEVILVYADPDTNECDLTVPVGHRPIECRGKGHE